MADTLSLGKKPLALEVNLYTEADFVDGLQRDDGTDWPAGSQLYLRIFLTVGDPVKWDADLEGTVASWNIDKADVMAAIAGKPKSAQLWFIDGEADLLWGRGKVQVDKT